MDYSEWVDQKMHRSPTSGITPGDCQAHLFDWQAMLVKMALKRGRFALFTDTGTGKTVMQVEWARQVSREGRVLIVAPLAVAEQTVREAARFGVDIGYLREDDSCRRVAITNYEMLSHFDPGSFVGVVLDESSILKSYDGKTRTQIIEMFLDTPYRLA
jgi:superfamily II DNA or RNA helicase